MKNEPTAPADRTEQTPLTDAETLHIWWNVEDQCWTGIEDDGYYVRAVLARELEIALRAARKARTDQFFRIGQLEAELEEARREKQEEWEIVDRIWKQLGFTTYEDLKGRSIHDLIDELKARAEQAESALRAEREKALEEAARVCEEMRNTRDWRVYTECAAAIRSLKSPSSEGKG